MEVWKSVAAQGFALPCFSAHFLKGWKMKVCTMNCGQGTGDKRSRAQIMRECEDCYDAPDGEEAREAFECLAGVSAMFNASHKAAAFEWLRAIAIGARDGAQLSMTDSDRALVMLSDYASLIQLGRQGPPAADSFDTVSGISGVLAKALSFLRVVVAELDTDAPHGPGHAHTVPGVWDRGEEFAALEACDWCATWRDLRAFVAAMPEPKVERGSAGRAEDQAGR